MRFEMKGPTPKEISFAPKDEWPIRLNRYLANAGIASRRDCDQFIQDGRVKVNDVVISELGVKVNQTDVVLFDDEPVSREKLVYVLLNKPKNFITTTDDPEGRKTVMDLVSKASAERLFPVGRLDRNTTGLLLLTNDGGLAQKLMHPSFEAEKVYHVILNEPLTKNHLIEISEGLNLEDGKVEVDEIAYVKPDDKREIGVEIHTGKNRIVRRIFESLGYTVEKLDRVVYASLTKLDLPRGHWRYLTSDEVRRLKRLSK
jgi:23S rRNA pseudouridine2605 synthase